MDTWATLITGIYWGLILNAIWIIPYFALLFYHFYAMENDPLYRLRYETSRVKVKKLGKKEAVIQESNLRIFYDGIKNICSFIWAGIKKALTKGGTN